MPARVRRLAALCAAAVAATAGAAPAFLRFESPGDRVIFDAVARADGRILYTGRVTAGQATTGAWLVAVAPDDTIAWQYELGATSAFPVRSAAWHPDGGVVALVDDVLIRLLEDGAPAWSVRVEGADAQAIAVAADGLIVVGGSVPDGAIDWMGNPRAQPWVGRLDATGALIAQGAFDAGLDGGAVKALAPRLDGSLATGVTYRETLNNSAQVVNLGSDLSPTWLAADWGSAWGGATISLRTGADGSCHVVERVSTTYATWSGRYARLDPDGRLTRTIEFATYDAISWISDAWPMPGGGATFFMGPSPCDDTWPPPTLVRFDAQDAVSWAVRSVQFPATRAVPIPGGETLMIKWSDPEVLLRCDDSGRTDQIACTSLAPCPIANPISVVDVAASPPPTRFTPSATVVPVSLTLVPTTATLVNVCAGPLPREPSALDLDPTAPPLLVTRAPLGALALSWEDTGDSAYDLYYGPVAAFAAGGCDHRSIACGLARPTTTIFPPAGSWYFLACSREGLLESALGRDAFGGERPEGSPRCP